jgi:hypothetical protein
MLAIGLATFDIGPWAIWIPIGAGLAIASMIFGFSRMYLRRRTRVTTTPRKEDLPWDKLLDLLRQRSGDRATSGKQNELKTEKMLGELVERLPPVSEPLELPEDREFQGNTERRIGNRRWGNPIGVYLYSTDSDKGVFGLVVNRAIGGLGIYTDHKFSLFTPLRVRPADAPSYVVAVQVEVRHCRRIFTGFFIGCKFLEVVPWNVRVCFG